LTNLVSSFVLKQTDKAHIFIITCGHKVHEECYTKYAEEKKQVSKCFLCKKKTNIIIPSIPKEATEEQGSKIVAKFMDSVFATLLSECQDKKADVLNDLL
jgi:aspartyl aminopeptidase